MSELTDKQIWEIFKPHVTGDKRVLFSDDLKPQFTLADLVGKTVGNHRRMENPKPYNPEVESPNPRYFDILEFADGSILLTEYWGWHDGTTLNCYLYNGKDVLFTNELFSKLDYD